MISPPSASPTPLLSAGLDISKAFLDLHLAGQDYHLPHDATGGARLLKAAGQRSKARAGDLRGHRRLGAAGRCAAARRGFARERDQSTGGP